MSFNPYYSQQNFQAPQQQQLGFQQTGYGSQFNSNPPQHTQLQQQQQANASFQQPQTQSSRSYDQLSFLSPQDQQRFETLFASHTNSVSISPESARSILLQSNLSPHNLARIWELSDINKTGDLLFPEFALALHLCNVVLRGGELPYILDPQIQQEVSQQVDKINFSIPEGQPSRTNSVANISAPAPAGSIFETNPVALGAATTQAPAQTGYNYQSQQSNSNTLQVNQTGFNQPQLFTSPQKPEQQEFTPYNAQALASQPTGFGFQNGNNFTQQETTSSFAPLQPQQTQNFGSLTQKQTGYSAPQQSQNQAPAPQQTQPQSFPSLTQQQTGFAPQQTGFNTQPQNTLSQSQAPAPAPLAHQPTGLVPLKTQTTSAPVQRQHTGMPTASMLAQQTTGYQPTQSSSTFQTSSLQQQPTGLVALNTQRTGQAAPLQQQPTGLVPLKNQQTGQPLTHQPTGLVPLNTQQTGLTQQPTGKLIPLNTQGMGSSAPLTQQPTGKLIPLRTQATGTTAAPLGQQPTGLVPLQAAPTGVPLAPLQAQKTGFGQNSFFLTNLVQQSAAVAQSYNYLQSMQMTSEEKKLFNKIFDNFDTERRGVLSAETCAEIFRKSGLNREDLEKVWDLVARANQTHLDKESFQMGMYLVYKRLNGFEIPEELPESMKPSSMRILDSVKSQLKVQGAAVKASKEASKTRIDGSRFKNNDDELITSASRHRRRATTKTEGEKSKSTKKLSTDELKKLINEKKILLDALAVQLEESAGNAKTYELEDLQAIEELKEKIKNLPSPSGGASSEREQLKARFNAITSKVPALLTEITTMDNSITGLKLELFKLKNPSSVVGTGPNGEITNDDRVRAKSKLLLAQKMAQLTGKPVDPQLEKMANGADAFNEEAQKIKQESVKNQQMIKDVESSIKEISSSVLNAFNIKTDDHDYKKWELGVGLQPEVQELVKSFRVNDVASKLSSITINTSTPVAPSYTSSPVTQTFTPSPVMSSPAMSSPSISSPTTTSTRPAYRTEEGRKAYIREQARKKMEERMAKLGIRKTSSSSTPSPMASPRVPHAQIPVPAPVPKPEPSPQPPVQNGGGPHQAEENEESSSDDDDEEEFQRMEEIRRLKRMERDARMAEMEAEETKKAESATPKYHDSNPFARKS